MIKMDKKLIIFVAIVILFLLFKKDRSPFGAVNTGSTAAPTITYSSTAAKSGTFANLPVVSLFTGDTITWPPNLYFTDSEMVIFNWFMNQDPINTYMSDKAMDVCYTKYFNISTNSISDPANTTSLNPSAAYSAPYGWNGPYITQPIASIVLGTAPVNSKGTVTTSLVSGGGGGAPSTRNTGLTDVNYTNLNLIRTTNITTVLSQYSNLYSYIMSCMSRIQMNITTTPIFTPAITLNTTGSFNDGAFYSDYTGNTALATGGINKPPFVSKMSFTSKLYKGINDVLQARQTQINNRLDITNSKYL